ncbi:MAG TPA: glycosyltransferase family 4 protein [Cytophagales bacterium]|nr:glycosyltransferase family 4 protein [Cytophagales bacterium]
MTKVLQILYSGLGGHGSVAFSLIEGDKNKRLDHRMLFYGIEELREEYQTKCIQYAVPFHSVKKKQGIDIGSYFKIYLALKRSTPDVILMHSVNLIVVGVFYRIFNNCKLVVVEHNANQIKRKSEWLWSLLSLVFASKVIYLTEKYKLEIKDTLSLFYREKKVEVIQNGINLNKFKKTEKRSSEEINLVMQSRFSPSSKDHETLIYAFAGLKKKLSMKFKVKLILAGDGENRKNMEELVQNLSLSKSVIFPGMLNEKALIELLANTDIYVHSSIAETMSTAIMQALAFGLPIIATDIPGINNMIEHKFNGLLFRPGDREGLLKLLVNLIENKEERSTLKKNARTYADEHLSSESMFNRYYSLLMN